MRQAVIFFLLALCCATGAYNTTHPLKVAFLMQGTVSDLGWNYELDIGRQYVQNLYPGVVRTFAKFWHEDDASITSIKAEEAIVNDGVELVIGTGFAAQAPLIEMASKYPNVNFFVMQGVMSTSNFGSALAKIYQARYLTGVLAGLFTKTNIIGYVAARPFGETYQGINAFAIGARKYNPKVQVKVVYMWSWSDPRLGKQATQTLLAMGADIITMHSGWDYTIPNTILEGGAFVMGYYSDMAVTLGNKVLTSARYNTGPLFAWIVDHALKGTWPNATKYFNLDSGVIEITQLSTYVTNTTHRDLVDQEAQAVIQGAIQGQEVIFCDPNIDAMKSYMIVDSKGCLLERQLTLMNTTVENVEIVEGNFYFNELRVDISDPLGAALAAIGAIITTINVLYFVCLVIYKETPIFRYATIPFCFIIIIGGFIGNIAYFLWLVAPTDGICVARLWLTSISFILVTSSLVVKNFRVWRIFTEAQKMIIATITNLQLTAVITIALGLEVIFLIVWTAADPLQKDLTTTATTANDERMVECSCTHISVFRVILYVGNGIPLAAGVLLAWGTRSAKSWFNESTMLGFTMYNMALLAVIVLPLVYIFNDKYTAIYVVQALMVGYINFSTMGLIFAPKVWIALVHPEENVGLSSNSKPTGDSSSPQRSAVSVSEGVPL